MLFIAALRRKEWAASSFFFLSLSVSLSFHSWHFWSAKFVIYRCLFCQMKYKHWDGGTYSSNGANSNIQIEICCKRGGQCSPFAPICPVYFNESHKSCNGLTSPLEWPTRALKRTFAFCLCKNDFCAVSINYHESQKLCARSHKNAIPSSRSHDDNESSPAPKLIQSYVYAFVMRRDK